MCLICLVLVLNQVAVLCPQSSDLVGLGWDLRICIFSKFLLTLLVLLWAPDVRTTVLGCFLRGRTQLQSYPSLTPGVVSDT